jgi:hypothetical protein
MTEPVNQMAAAIQIAKHRISEQRQAERKVADAIILERAVRVLERRLCRFGLALFVTRALLTALARQLRTEAGWHE